MKWFFKIFILILMMNSETSAQEITVFPGFWGQKYYVNSDRISVYDVGTLMKEVPVADAYWRRSKTQMSGAWVAVGAQFGFLFWQINKLKNGESGSTQLVGNIACGVIGIGLSLASNNSRQKAILSYNKLIKKKGDQSYYFEPASTGLGIGMKF
ncbi:MAG: hypothetical protein IPL08_14610 [Saprospiraceae bacterium]|nr:hypothetical protein [Saprospiraceae bacterium]